MSYFGPGGTPADDAGRRDPGWVKAGPGAVGTYRVDEVEMTLAEALAVLQGQGPRRNHADQRGAALAIGDVRDLTACSVCGELVYHPPTHIEYHKAQTVVAFELGKLLNQGPLSDDDQREADACATGDAG